MSRSAAIALLVQTYAPYGSDSDRFEMGKGWKLLLRNCTDDEVFLRAVERCCQTVDRKDWAPAKLIRIYDAMHQDAVAQRRHLLESRPNPWLSPEEEAKANAVRSKLAWPWEKKV